MDNPIKKYFAKKQEEENEMSRRNPDGLPTKFRCIVYIIVGAYLIYLVYEMFSEGGFKPENKDRLLVIISSIIFIPSGIFFIIRGIKALVNGQYFDPNAPEPDEDDEKENEPEPEPEPKEEGPKRLSDLAKLTESAQVPEDEQ